VSAYAALAKLITSFYPTAIITSNKNRIDSLEAKFNDALRPRVSSSVFARSQAFGYAIADAVIAWSQSDNSNLGNSGYVPPVFPGAWQPTPPAFANGICPCFGNTRPFLAQNLQAIGIKRKANKARG
jgi:hypothetical protein